MEYKQISDTTWKWINAMIAEALWQRHQPQMTKQELTELMSELRTDYLIPLQELCRMTEHTFDDVFKQQKKYGQELSSLSTVFLMAKEDMWEDEIARDKFLAKFHNYFTHWYDKRKLGNNEQQHGPFWEEKKKYYTDMCKEAGRKEKEKDRTDYASAGRPFTSTNPDENEVRALYKKALQRASNQKNYNTGLG